MAQGKKGTKTRRYAYSLGQETADQIHYLIDRWNSRTVDGSWNPTQTIRECIQRVYDEELGLRPKTMAPAGNCKGDVGAGPSDLSPGGAAHQGDTAGNP